MVPITQLPDLCMLAIFERIPVTNLISSISCVCKKWNALQPVALGQRKRLVLVSDDRLYVYNINDMIDSVQMIDNQFGSKLIESVEDDGGKPWARVMSRSEIEFNLIEVPKVANSGDCTLTEELATSLMAKFKGLTHLIVAFGLNCIFTESTNTTLRQLARIIDHYEASLVTLQVDLCGDFVGNIDEHLDEAEDEIDVQVLFDSINRIHEQLDHVRLNIDIQNAKLSADSFAFLAQVKSFALDNLKIGDDSNRLLLASLRQLAIGGTCNHIEIGRWRSSLEMKQANQLDPQLAAKFHRLAVTQQEEEEERGGDAGVEDEDEEYEEFKENTLLSMSLFGHRFTSLRSLELRDVCMPITKVTQCLTRLTELIHLNLEGQFHEDVNESGGELVIAQLPSVRMLTLDLTSHKHSDFETMHLGEIFPKLQVLRYETMHDQCEECGLSRFTYKETPHQRQIKLKKMGKCVLFTLQSLPRLIPSLHLVQYDPSAPLSDEKVLHVGLHDKEQLSQLGNVSTERPQTV